MIKIIGEKHRFAICFQVSLIESPKKIWGGFEVWLNNQRFGDVWYFDLLTGNNYWLIERLAMLDVGNYPFDEPMSEKRILDEIFLWYFGNHPFDLSTGLKHALDLAQKWGPYVFIPNNNTL